MEREKEKYKERVGLNMKQEELVKKVRKEEEESGKKGVSLIVVGEWDSRTSLREAANKQDMLTPANPR